MSINIEPSTTPDAGSVTQPQEHLEDATHMPNGELRAKYKLTYDSWRNAKHRAGSVGRDFDPLFESFREFLRNVGPRPSRSHSLDRIDNARGYVLDNVRWADSKTQNNNKGDTIHLAEGGAQLPLSQVADRTGQNPNTLRSRRSRGWTDEEVIQGRRTSPPRASPSPLKWPWPPENGDVWEARYQKEKHDMCASYAGGVEHRVHYFVRKCQEKMQELGNAAEEYMLSGTPTPDEFMRRYNYWSEMTQFAIRQRELAIREEHARRSLEPSDADLELMARFSGA